MLFTIILVSIVTFLMKLIFQKDKDEIGPKGQPEPRRSEPEPEPRLEPEDVAQWDETQLSWAYIYKLPFDESLPEDDFDTEIAGLQYNCSMKDVGWVNGVVRPEPENPFDSKAQAVFRADGKKLGYIPRSALDHYAEFNPRNVECPFVGQIIRDYSDGLMGFILVVLPSTHAFAIKRLSGYLEKL